MSRAAPSPMSPHAAMRSATARFKPCLLRLRRPLNSTTDFHRLPVLAAAHKTRLTLTAEDKAAALYEVIGQTGAMVDAGGSPASEGERSDPETEVGGTRSFLPAVEGMRACAAIGVVITHAAFQTGQHSGLTGRLFGRFD